MRWNEIDFNPTPRTMRQFALLWLAFFGGLALWRGVGEDRWAALGFGMVALLGGIGGFVRPSLLRSIYVGWMILVFPLGLGVSYLLLAMLYFGLITPLGLILKLAGRDPLQCRTRPARDTYWLPKPATTDVRRYFRPY